MLETATLGTKLYRPWPSLTDATEYIQSCISLVFLIYFISQKNQIPITQAMQVKISAMLRKWTLCPGFCAHFTSIYQTVQAQTSSTVLYLKFPQKGCWRFKCSGMWQCVPWPVVPEIPRDLQPLMMALQSSEISRTTHHQTPCHIPETEHSTHHIKRLSWTQHNLILGVRSTIDSSHHQKQYCNQNIRDSIILKCTSQKWCEVVDWIHLAHDRDQWKALVNTVMYSHVHKMGGMSWLAEKLLAFQGWLTCKEWAT